MEDAATAEIARSQIWQWIGNGVRLDTGETVTADLVRAVEDEELSGIRSLGRRGGLRLRAVRRGRAPLFERVALADGLRRLPHDPGVRADRLNGVRTA